MTPSMWSYPGSNISRSNLNDSPQDKNILVRKRRFEPLTWLTAINTKSQVLLLYSEVSNGKIPTGFSTNFNMTVTNDLGYELGSPITFVKHGKTSTPIKTIDPYSEETLTGHNSRFSFYGSSGMACWNVDERQLDICIYWE